MDKPLVSVIMGVYNQWDEKILYDAVKSILAQTYKKFEFIIWNDGSHPRVGQMIKCLDELDDRIVVVGKEENRGLAFSLNECIRIAKGKYIARMDADDISLPQRLERQVKFLESNPQYGWCGTCVELIDENGVWGVRMMTEEPNRKDYYRYSPFVHPSVMFRAELFGAEHRYRENEETLRCEDYEMFMSLMQNGVRGYNIQEILFQYRENKDSYNKRSIKTRINETKIRYRNFKKMNILFPIGWLFVLRPIVACAIPTRLLGFIKRAEGKRMKNFENDKDMVEREKYA